MIILQNLITTNHRKSGKSKDDLKLTELDVVTMRIRYRVNGVLYDTTQLDWIAHLYHWQLKPEVRHVFRRPPCLMAPL